MIIAIDGYSSTGKSTIAKKLAKELNVIHIDTGALYRGITLYALKYCCKNESIDKETLIKNLKNIHLDFKFIDSQIHLFLNGEDISMSIREPEVSRCVSEVAAMEEVRNFLLDIQRNYGRHTSVIMDGRDIGTTIFPNADIKFFLTACVEERTKRRFLELQKIGKNISREEVKQNLIDRDYMDSHRSISPLIRANDAILIDNSNLTQEETLQKMLEEVKKISHIK